MKLAPIILFVFNRPEHTRATMESLKNNPLAADSELFVFSDGPRNRDDVETVAAVRAVIDATDGFKSITVNKRSSNRGLAGSVIEGVTDIIRRYGKVIVLEDDLQLSPYFLNYMNEALCRYENDQRIFSIGGYTPRLDIPEEYDKESFLSYRCCTWGWATWGNRWSIADWDVTDFDSFINDKKAVELFNRGGDDMSHIFKLQMAGKISSWAIRWDYAHFRNNAYCFRPIASLVSNTGNDGSGVHCSPTDKFNVPINTQSTFVLPDPDELSIDEEINRRFATFYDGRDRSGVTSVNNILTMYIERLKRWIARHLK